MGVAYGVNPEWAMATNEGRTHIATKGVYANNLVFNLDFGSNTSYSGSGVNIYDLTGNYPGTLVNGPTVSSTDLYGGAVLDGNDDYLDFNAQGTSSNVSVVNNFTIEQVFKPIDYQPGTYFGLTNMLVHKGSASTFNYSTQVTTDTSVSFIKRSGAEVLQYHTFTVPSMLFRPTHLTFVVTNGTSGSGTVACYHNGTFIGSTTITGAAIAAVAGDPFRMGNVGIANSAFKGTYYSCRIYNESLSAASIQKNFNAVRKRFGI